MSLFVAIVLGAAIVGLLSVPSLLAATRAASLTGHAAPLLPEGPVDDALILFHRRDCHHSAGVRRAVENEALIDPRVRLIDADLHLRTAAAYRVQRTPTLVRVVDGQVVATHHGPGDRTLVRALLDGEPVSSL